MNENGMRVFHETAMLGAGVGGATAILAASGVDLGLFFFILAAIVSQAVPLPVRQPYWPVLHRPLGKGQREDAYGI